MRREGRALLGKVIRAAQLALRASKAEDLAAAGDGHRAMAVLQKVYAGFAATPPSPKLPIELNILACQVAIQVADGPLALSAAETGLAQLRSGTGRYSAADREYLVCTGVEKGPRIGVIGAEKGPLIPTV